jgi:hypothetical protein
VGIASLPVEGAEIEVCPASDSIAISGYVGLIAFRKLSSLVLYATTFPDSCVQPSFEVEKPFTGPRHNGSGNQHE